MSSVGSVAESELQEFFWVSVNMYRFMTHVCRAFSSTSTVPGLKMAVAFAGNSTAIQEMFKRCLRVCSCQWIQRTGCSVRWHRGVAASKRLPDIRIRPSAKQHLV